MILKVNDKLKRKFWEYVSYEECINLYIIADVEIYGFEAEFQDVWMQIDENDNTTSIMLKYYKNLIVYSYENNYDLQEMIAHIKNLDIKYINGKKSVIDKLTTKYIDYIEKKECLFCTLKNINQLDFGEIGEYKVHKADIKDLKNIHNLLCQEKKYNLEEYLHSKSYQLKTNSCRIYYIKKNKEIISTCSTSVENDFLGMLNNLMTKNEYRNQGISTYLVYSISKSLLSEGKYPCVIYYDEESEKIYKDIGYEIKDKWTILAK